MLAVSILSAELRSASEARQKLTTALAAPEPVRAFDLAVLVAAEERHEEDVGEIRESIDQSIAELAERSSTRVRLAELVGSAADEHAVAAAVGATLFGSGAPDDDGSAFFAGSSEADYYDPANSFVDAVLQRRVGIPISLGLVYCECCERLGLPMVVRDDRDTFPAPLASDTRTSPLTRRARTSSAAGPRPPPPKAGRPYRRRRSTAGPECAGAPAGSARGPQLGLCG